ncbi:MAG: protein TolR [Alphaproteobacteria bacterium]|nr:protein TolR [Alphaproteobacteria bacterium]
MAGVIHSAGSGGGGSRFRRRQSFNPIADINVTPLVDVMLVLLIIFMVTAPLLQVGVPVDLPKTSAQQVGGKDEPLVVSVNSKGEVFLGETPYDIAALSAKLKAVHEEKPDQRVFMRGDKAVDYGKMMEVMGVVIDSGFRQLGLLGEQAQQLGKGGGTVTPVPGTAPRAPQAPAAQPPASQPTPRR